MQEELAKGDKCPRRAKARVARWGKSAMTNAVGGSAGAGESSALSAEVPLCVADAAGVAVLVSSGFSGVLS